MNKIDSADVKRYLLQVKYINNHIDSRQRELDSVRMTYVRASSIKQDKVDEPGTGHYDDKYMRLFELSEEINKEVDELIDLQRDIRQQVNQLPDQLEAFVLRERYLNDMTWESIAEMLNQSDRNVHNLHGKALISFGQQFAKEITEYAKVCS